MFRKTFGRSACQSKDGYLVINAGIASILNSNGGWDGIPFNIYNRRVL